MTSYQPHLTPLPNDIILTHLTPPPQFPAALSELGSRTLWVTVWHSDMFGRNDFLGEVLLPLGSLPLDDSTAPACWHTLQERVSGTGGRITWEG